MPCGRFAAGCNQRGRCGEDHLRAVLDCRLHGLLGLFAGTNTKKRLCDHLVPKNRLHVSASLLVCLDPVAVFGIQFMDKGNIQIGGQHGENTLVSEFSIVGSPGINRNGLRTSKRLDVLPNRLKALR